MVNHLGEVFDYTYLQSGIISRADDPNFEDVYQCYEKCFTLAEERESKENFLRILERNEQEETRSKAGECREIWLFLKYPVADYTGDKEGVKMVDQVVAAANFDVFAGNEASGIAGTVHGIYMFVDPAFRNQGLFSRLIEKRYEVAQDFIKQVNGAKGQLIIFAEQNAPLLMTAKSYVDDTRKSQMDQCKRREVFEKRGFRTLKFRYIQPRLSSESLPCTYLELVAAGVEEQNFLPAVAIKEHLSRFFALSFPEGTTLDQPDVAVMKADLEANERIEFYSVGKFQELGEILNVKILSQLPPDQQNVPLGKLYPQAAQAYYGKDFNEILKV